MDNLRIANELVDIARNMLVRTASANPTINELREFKKHVNSLTATDSKGLDSKAKEVSVLASDFKETHSSLISEVIKMEKDIKEKKKLLKGYYNDWSKKSGYDDVKKTLLDQAQSCLETGDMLADLADDLVIGKRDSTQESWKEKYNVLVSMLNDAELLKYSRLLNSFFRKQTTELKVGLSELDGAVKDWHEEAKAIAEERGFRLPRASVGRNTRNAGILEDLSDVIKGVVPKLIRRIMNWGKRFLKSVILNGAEIFEIQDELRDLDVRVRRVLR